MDNNDVNSANVVVNEPVNEEFTSKQATTYSFRVTAEQKAELRGYQQQFGNQIGFVNRILDLLRGGSKQSEYSPYQMALLEYVAKRESTDDVTVQPENVLMYIFDVLLVKGDKFNIDAIPDNVIRRYRKEFLDD